MADDFEQSLGDAATFAGQAKRRPSPEMSLGDERTLAGDSAAGIDTTIDDIEIVDLEARYKIDGTLGQGGMGAVLLATDTRLDRKVAIKRILGDAAGNRMAVQRFLTEAKAIAALNHPNVVQIYDYGRAKDGPFLIMEYVDGGSLLDKCRGTAIPLEEAIDLACQLCDGLGKAHELGIIHRDIKPANVLLTKDGIPKLTDFGLAKAEASDHGQTMTGAVLGTPDFMPPEQRRDASEVDTRSDLWSLAATLYQMVTGRSPKIIRFDLLPTELTKALAKALEEDKDARYQTAKELREAIRSSQRDTGAPDASLGEGQCPGCGTKNDSTRRFCRSCGGSLEAPCLSCSKPMPMWEEICGQCGSKQLPLVEERRAAMVVKQSEAESGLADFDFDRALRIATTLKDEPDPRLRQLIGWAEHFIAEIDTKRQEQLALAARSLTEALRHEKAFDYTSGVHALELVPAILRDVQLPGPHETVAAVFQRLSAKQAESRRLDGLIKSRIAGRQLAGLLSEVERLLVLRPDRQDVQKLKTQLEERHQKLGRQRDEAVAKARRAMAAHDYRVAAAALAAIDRSVITSEAESLAAEANERWAQVQELVAQIKSAVAVKRYDGLLEWVEELLRLMPQDSDAQRLRQSLLAREEKTAAEVVAIESQANAAWHACHFTQAAKLIERIPESRRSDRISTLRDACEDMGMTQSMAVKAMKSLTPDSDIAAHDSAIGQARCYQSLLEQWSLTDKPLEESLSWCLQGRASLVAAQETQEQQQRLMRTMMFSAAAVAVAVVAAVGAGWARSAYRASQIASALSQRRWDEALAIEPGNVAALIGRAVGKLEGNSEAIATAFKDLDEAEARGTLMPEWSAAKAQAVAARGRENAKAGRLADAEKDYAEAKRLRALPASLNSAADAIAAAWLARADVQTKDDKDNEAVLAACNKAKYYGAADDRVAPFETQALMRKAALLIKQGKPEEGVSLAGRLCAEQPKAVRQLASQPWSSELLTLVADNCQKEFRKAAIAAQFDVAAAIEARAAEAGFDCAGWMTSLIDEEPSVLKALPPELLTKLLPHLRSMPQHTAALLPSVTNSLGMPFRFVPSGTLAFHYVRNQPEPSSTSVAVQGFFISEHEITQREYREVMGAPPRSRGLSNIGSNIGAGIDEAILPARAAEVADDEAFPVMAAMSEAIEFCRRLSELPKEKAMRRYRLPHEEEWRHACCLEKQVGSLLDYAWLLENSGKQFHRVATRQSNAWGLFDTIGNAPEWVAESLTPASYPDRFNLGGGLYAGGSFATSATTFQSPMGLGGTGGSSSDDIRHGFRVAMDMQPLDSAGNKAATTILPSDSLREQRVKGVEVFRKQ